MCTFGLQNDKYIRQNQEIVPSLEIQQTFSKTQLTAFLTLSEQQNSCIFLCIFTQNSSTLLKNAFTLSAAKHFNRLAQNCTISHKKQESSYSNFVFSSLTECKSQLSQAQNYVTRLAVITYTVVWHIFGRHGVLYVKSVTQLLSQC